MGTIEGIVFKDLNSDGLRQRDEAPVEGIKIWLGKKESQATDLFGYYKFTKVKARKAYVNLDTSTLPTGYALTVPSAQEVTVAHHGTVRVDFGIISSTVASGFVFEDKDSNGIFNGDDRGVEGVVFVLDGKDKVTTGPSGKYSFSDIR